MYANPRKTTSIKELGQIELGSLVDDILAIPESVWEMENASKPNRFETLDKTNRYAVCWRVQTAKKPETRAKRVETLVAMLARGEKIH